MISVTTADGRRKPGGTSVRLTGGSDSFGKVSVSNSQNSGPWPHNISARNLLLKGFVGVRNLGDKDHFANVRINASNNRYFEPAAGRTWYAGLEFVF